MREAARVAASFVFGCLLMVVLLALGVPVLAAYLCCAIAGLAIGLSR